MLGFWASIPTSKSHPPDGISIGVQKLNTLGFVFFLWQNKFKLQTNDILRYHHISVETKVLYMIIAILIVSLGGGVANIILIY